MKKLKKLPACIRMIAIVAVFGLVMTGCSAKKTKQDNLTIGGDIYDAEKNDADTSANAADADRFGQQVDISKLSLSPYTEADFDASGKVLLQTEHVVIDKEMDNISYTIANLSDEELEYGEEYILEIRAEEQWYQVPFPEGYGWDAVAYILPAGGIRGDILNLSWMDFEFVDGEYRIVKRIGNYLVRAEFSIGESNITPDTPYGYEKLEDLPLSYTIDDAIEDNVVVLGYQKSYNLDTLEAFVNNVRIGIPAMVRLGFSTIEGDPIFYDVVQNVTHDGRKWFTLYHDSRRDNFLSEEDRIITKNNYSYIVTDGTSIYFSNFAEYADTELFHESSMGIYAGDYLCQSEIIDIIEEITTNRLKSNVTRYKSFSPEGTYYVSLTEEQLARLPELQICGYPLAEDMDAAGNELDAGQVSFGFGTQGYSISDYIINAEGNDLIKQTAIIGVESVSWIDDETAVLRCATMHKDVHYNIEFYPKEAIDKK